jgi:hypothetical protein
MNFRSTLLLTALIGVPSLAQTLPPDNAYVQVKRGHLTLDGQRQRYWAAIGQMMMKPDLKPSDSAEVRAAKIAQARLGTNIIVDRLHTLGFNAVRLWDTAPNQENYIPGDGSNADMVDYFIAQAKAKGFKIWTAGLNNVGTAKASDVGIVNDPTTAQAWQEAVGEKGISDRNFLARVWDARVEAIYLRNMKAVSTHLNKHTGLRWCDDPVFVVWELSNEEWWHRKMVGGQWQKLPPFFKNSLISQWNGWLQKKYGNDAKLKAAWNGLLAGETLKNGTILLAPMAGTTSAKASMNDANPIAAQALENVKQELKREDFAEQRARDVVAFFLDIQLAHKKREAAAVKSWGKSTRLSPLIFDTGIGYEIQSQYLHQNAEAIAHDAYVNGTGPAYEAPDLSKAKNERERMYMQLDKERISANAANPNTAPWVNWLLKPPGISQGVPWLEHNRVQGMPFLCYETQIQQPAKYRADFPLRIAALASIQDWDFICWHYFAPYDGPGKTNKPFERAMDVTTGGHPQGYHFTFDEVQNATMRAAAWMFRQNRFKAAPNPTQFIYGQGSLYDPESMNYGGSYGARGMDMLQTVYQHGVRIKIDPKRKGDKIIGPVVRFDDRNTHNPYTPTAEIVFDWKKGFLRMDAPGAHAWTGLLANYGDKLVFRDGVVVSDVSFNNPPGIFDPIRDDEKYLAFTLHTLDEKPLAQSSRAALSLVSTSFNSGYSYKERRAGSLPVLVARVGATIQSSALNGFQYTLRDWNWDIIGQGTISDGKLTISNTQPVFVVELSR